MTERGHFSNFIIILALMSYIYIVYACGLDTRSCFNDDIWFVRIEPLKA